MRQRKVKNEEEKLSEYSQYLINEPQNLKGNGISYLTIITVFMLNSAVVRDNSYLQWLNCIRIITILRLKEGAALF